MFCTQCGQQTGAGEKFCVDCKSKNQIEAIPPQKTETKKSKVKSFWIKTISIIVFLVAFGTVRYLTQEGISSISNSTQEKETEKKVTSYFADTATTDWKDFNSTLGGFKASFPKYPSHDTMPLSIESLGTTVNLESYTAEQSDGTTYVISFGKYPASLDTSNPENNLEGSVNGSVEATNGTLISSSFSSFGSYKAIDYVIYVKSADLYYKGKNILVGKTIYQLGAVYESDNASNVELDRFLNSFQLL